jgi:thiol-disulfide isomerase/thioredoxin
MGLSKMEEPMKCWSVCLLSLLLAACAVPAAVPVPSQSSNQPSTEQNTLQSDYPDLGAAPDLSGDVWLNTAEPLHLANLRGKVVLVDMWTFGCINCQHVIPSLRDWYHQYTASGLVVIGNHYPEFGYEHELKNLKQAVVDLDVPYAVVQDNDGTNWNAFHNRYWPTLYLIDKRGQLRYIHIGEGSYRETETAIKALLDEPAQ